MIVLFGLYTFIYDSHADFKRLKNRSFMYWILYYIILHYYWFYNITIRFSIIIFSILLEISIFIFISILLYIGYTSRYPIDNLNATTNWEQLISFMYDSIKYDITDLLI